MGHSTATALSLRKALRNSPWLVIAAGLHGIVLAALGVVYVVQHRAPPAPEDVRIQFTPHVELEPPDVLPPPPQVGTKPPPDEPTELVEVPIDFEPLDPAPVDPSTLFDPVGPVGPTDLPMGPITGSSAIGTGGPGVRGTGTSGVFSIRPGLGGGVGPTGRKPLATADVTEKAVLEGLRWLARHQQPDGSWSAATLGELCTPGRPCEAAGQDYARQYDPGLTGLALLAFLGKGLDNRSKAILVDPAFGKPHPVGVLVGDGLKWLLNAQAEDGSFRDYPGLLYNEAIGALALSEAWGLSGNPKYKAAAERAIRYLVAAQKTNPFGTGRWGWRYTPGGDPIADTSVTGWVVMALKSAQLTGLAVPTEAMDGAVDYVTWATGKDGLVGYLDPQGAGAAVSGHGDQFDYHVGTMSALGMLVRTFTRHDIKDPFLELAAQQLAKDPPRVSEDRLSVDYYYWYYGALALNQFDGPDSPRADRGKYWKPWNEAMITALLQLQDGNTEREVCSRGGWLTPDRWCYAGGPVYATALNVLTLEVYYRYTNAFGAVAKGEGR
jgi:Prenyltransferase and squalene oxidase repeat